MYDLYTIRVISENYINYSYLGIDRKSRKAFVIDPAWSIDEILQILRKQKGNLEAIFLTHSHEDHMNKAEELLAISEGIIYMSREEYEYYELSLPTCKFLSHGQTIKLGNTYIEAFLTPGHTKGSMCYRAENNIFTGDTLFIEGCGICTLEGGDAREMFQSLQFLKENLQKEDYIYPGHSFLKPVGKKAECLKENLYMCIHNESDFFKIRMRKNQSDSYEYR